MSKKRGTKNNENITSDIYKQVITDVIENLSDDFERENVDEEVLVQLKNVNLLIFFFIKIISYGLKN